EVPVRPQLSTFVLRADVRQALRPAFQRRRLLPKRLQRSVLTGAMSPTLRYRTITLRFFCGILVKARRLLANRTQLFYPQRLTALRQTTIAARPRLAPTGDGTETAEKPAGTALSSNGNHVAIVCANAATLFTRSVAVDDRVFLAITNQQH